MKNDRRKYSILKSAFVLAVLYLPLFAISDLVKAWCPFDSSIAAYILPAFSSLLCFCALISESMKTALKKWAFSIPFTLMFWLILSVTDFSVRLTNTLYPGYGRLSAGGGFALMMDFGILSLSQGMANLLAVGAGGMLTGRFQRLRFVIQDVLLPVISMVIFLLVLYLELTMPTTAAIYRSVYG